jgi:hypothetical protein
MLAYMKNKVKVSALALFFCSIDMETNNTNFPLHVTEYFNTIKEEKRDGMLKEHQHIIVQYVINSKERGVLVFWGMGYGKTYVATAIAEFYRTQDPSRQIIFLGPKSLTPNFKQSVLTYAKNNGNTDDDILRKYKFVSSNASNMLKRLQESDSQIYDDRLGLIPSSIKSLDNTLLLVDEAHNLFNAISNGSKNATGLYDMVMRAKNIKIIFLTGTPAINEPYELVPCFNMLKGKTLFPENYSDFREIFINADSTIKNKHIFQNRILGLCTYYGPAYFTEEDDFHKEHFPNELPTEVIKVPMSKSQYQSYHIAREKEKSEMHKQQITRDADRFKSKMSMASSYRIESRQLCNFLYPDSAIDKLKKRMPEKLSVEMMTDAFIDEHFPKFKVVFQLIKKLRSENKALGIVYSGLIQSGINPFVLCLEAKGWTQWKYSKFGGYNKDIYGADDVDEKSEGTFAVVSGDVKPEIREQIVNEYNKEDNMYGGVIDLLIVSSTGVEGIDLKGGRYSIMLEPYWNAARIDQFRTRIARYNSHIHLKPEERNTQMFIILSDCSQFNKNEDSTDIVLYNKSMKYKELNNVFYQALIEASIDCSFHKASLASSIKDKINCLLCNPSNTPLYTNNIKADLKKNPCQPLNENKSKTIKANEIIVNDIAFYYTIDENQSVSSIKIYMKPNNLDKYVQIDDDHPMYIDVLRQIMEKK